MINKTDVHNAELFIGPKLKHERAESHIHELEDVLEAYASRNPYSLLGEMNPETEAWQVRVVMREDVPEVVPLIVGDAVHNLRSALDVLANDLLALTESNEERIASFPFWSTPKGRAEALKRIKSIDPRLRSRIEALKPYTGMDGQGDAILYGIHHLDIIDKHRIIIAINALTTIASYQSGDEIEARSVDLLVKNGDIVASGVGLNTFQFYKNPKGTFNVAFAEVQLFGGRLVVDTLIEMANLTHDIIADFESFSLDNGLIHG